MPIIVTNNFPPSHGGVQTMLHNLALHMHQLGAQIIVVAPDQAGAAQFDASLPYQVLRYKNWKRPLFMVSMTQQYLRARKLANDPTAIVSGWWPPGLAVASLPAPMRSPYYVLTHGMEIGTKGSALRQKLLRHVYRNAKGAIFNSSYTSDLTRAAGLKVRGEVIPPGVTSNPIAPNRSPRPTVLSAGRLIARKGFDITLKAVAELKKEIPDIHYDIVGNGPQRNHLEQLVNNLGIRENVTFHYSADDASLRDAYARAWCFALPVRRIGGDVEGFGIVYLEAAMASLPAIGGWNSGAIDAIEEGKSGVLVDGTQVAEVVAALRRILIDREYAQELGMYGKQRALEQFNWTRIAEKYLNFLRP